MIDLDLLWCRIVERERYYERRMRVVNTRPGRTGDGFAAGTKEPDSLWLYREDTAMLRACYEALRARERGAA